MPRYQTAFALPHVIDVTMMRRVGSIKLIPLPETKPGNAIGLKRVSFGACPLGLVPMKHYLVTAR